MEWLEVVRPRLPCYFLLSCLRSPSQPTICCPVKDRSLKNVVHPLGGSARAAQTHHRHHQEFDGSCTKTPSSGRSQYGCLWCTPECGGCCCVHTDPSETHSWPKLLWVDLKWCRVKTTWDTSLHADLSMGKVLNPQFPLCSLVLVY